MWGSGMMTLKSPKRWCLERHHFISGLKGLVAVGNSHQFSFVKHFFLWVGDWSTECLKEFHILPGGLTWNLKIPRLKSKMIFQTIIFRFHVNLPGCSHYFLKLSPAISHGVDDHRLYQQATAPLDAEETKKLEIFGMQNHRKWKGLLLLGFHP